MEWDTDNNQFKVGDGASTLTFSDDSQLLSNIVEDTTPQLGGDLDLNGNGLTEELTAATGNTFAAGDVAVVGSTGDMILADASAESTCKGPVFLALEAISATTSGTFMRLGRYTTTGLTAGSEYYVSETAGDYTTTRPSTAGTIVRPIGMAISTTVLVFDGSGTYVENAA